MPSCRALRRRRRWPRRLNALRAQRVHVYHMHTEGSAAYTTKECRGVFKSRSFFCGANDRDAVNDGRAEFIPSFLRSSHNVNASRDELTHARFRAGAPTNPFSHVRFPFVWPSMVTAKTGSVPLAIGTVFVVARRLCGPRAMPIVARSIR